MQIRNTILCLAASLFWLSHVSDMAYGASAEYLEAYGTFTALYQQGRHSETVPYAKEVLRLEEEEFGPNDPTTATLLNVAGLYQAQGKYAEAEPLCKRALAIRGKAVRPEHPNVAQSLNNLAELYRD